MTVRVLMHLCCLSATANCRRDHLLTVVCVKMCSRLWLCSVLPHERLLRMCFNSINWIGVDWIFQRVTHVVLGICQHSVGYSCSHSNSVMLRLRYLRMVRMRYLCCNLAKTACPTVERSTILIHVCGSLHCWTTLRQWSDPRFVDQFLDSIHAAEIMWLCVYIALLLLLIKMAVKISNIQCNYMKYVAFVRCKQMKCEI